MQRNSLKSIVKSLITFLSPYTWFFGKPRKVEHIWPPKNYSSRSKLLYLIVDRPLAIRGIFSPKHGKPFSTKQDEFSTFHNEHQVIFELINDLGLGEDQNYFVDIGAGDGIDMSNTYLLAAQGWLGVSIEYDPSKFAMLAVTYRDLPKIELVKSKVKPKSINSMLNGLEVPKEVQVLNLDIDSFDYYVLEALLSEFRFKIMCLEINPVFPITIDFAVKFSENESVGWAGDNFQGMSLSMAYKLLENFGYKIVKIDRSSVFAVQQSQKLNKFSKIAISEFQKILDKSLETKNYGWILNRYRSDNPDGLLRKFKDEFTGYADSTYYLSTSGF